MNSKNETLLRLKKEGYSEQFELASKYINNLSLKRKVRVLDVGADVVTPLKAFLDDKVEYYSLDAIKGCDFVVDLDKEKIPIKDNYFDVIVCFDALEHCCYPTKVMEEITRVGKEKGLFIGSMPNEYNIYSRVLFMAGILTEVRKPFTILPDHVQHIHIPRVEDIISFFGKYVEIIKIKPIWHSRSFKKLDGLMSMACRIYPSLFSRGIIVIGNLKQDL